MHLTVPTMLCKVEASNDRVLLTEENATNVELICKKGVAARPNVK